MEPQPPTPQPAQTQETPKGRRICAWCKKDWGPSGAEGDSHGICKECWLKEFPYVPWTEPEEGKPV